MDYSRRAEVRNPLIFVISLSGSLDRLASTVIFGLGRLRRDAAFSSLRAIVDKYASNDSEATEAVAPDHMIDIENIRDVMEGVAGYFEGVDGLLNDLKSAAL